jgi:RNA polymerase sigma-70 factor (ECF subfamily)
VTAGAATALASPQDAGLVRALRAGDEAAFASVVREHGPSMLRVALLFVSSRAVAEEVVQETWMSVVKGLDHFEGRSSFKTWLFRILTNRAKTRAEREKRSIPFSALARPEGEDNSPVVDPDRFLPADHEQWPGHWAAPPRSWAGIPEERLLGSEALDVIRTAIENLRPAQRTVILMRDVEGWSAEEVCSALGVSEANQRVLLHRARSCVRSALENYFDEQSGVVATG